MLTLYVNVQCYKLNREKEGEIERGERERDHFIWNDIKLSARGDEKC